MKNYKRFHIVAFALIWITAVLFGIAWLERYSHTPGQQATAPQSWPEKTELSYSNKPKLLVFLHPECSCSEATVAELGRLLVQVPRDIQVYAIFVKPDGWSDDEVKSDLWQRTSRIPNLKIVLDKERKEAKLFGALTSGHTLLYDQQGQLIFSGGITGARGHEGDNDGKSALIKLLNNDKSIRAAQTKIFGCELFEK